MSMELPGPELDLNALKELREIMGDDFRTLITAFITDSDDRLQGLSRALSESDAEQVRMLAHGFKGSAGNMAAKGLAAMCQTLETMGREGDLEGGLDLLVAVELSYEMVKVELNALVQ